MRTLDTKHKKGDSKALLALKSFVSWVYKHGTNGAIQAASDYLETDSDLNDFEKLLHKFKTQTKSIVIKKYDPHTSQFKRLTIDRVYIGI